MIEIQCTSCHTRYRIDERVLPEDSPTFKCSRCGHVFTTNPIPKKEAPGADAPRPRIERPRREPPKPRPEPEAAAAAEEPQAPPQPEARQPDAPQPSSNLNAEQPEPSRTEAATPNADAPVNANADDTSAHGETPNAAPRRYFRAPRAPVFQPVGSSGDPIIERAKGPADPEEGAEPLGEVDDSAVARMKAAMASAPRGQPAAPAAPQPRASEAAPRAKAPQPQRAREDSGENLSFEFDDDGPELGERESEPHARPDRWSVGDDIPYVPRDRAYGPPEPAPFGGGTIPEYAGAAIMERERRRDDLPDDAAFLERAAGLHSAGYFIGLFFVVAVVFTALTLIICGAPSASADLLSKLPVIGPNFVAPTPLEAMVAVSDVQAHYETVKGGRPALVLSGIAENTSQLPLHVVEIGVRLLDPAQHPLASSAVYCGNTLSPKMITEMTPHELEFLQKLDPQKNFVLQPSHSAPFLMVFIDPPRDVSRFAVAVAKAEPPAQAAPSAAATAQP
jgi:predicted Zn finger-like uncharacterized protein